MEKQQEQKPKRVEELEYFPFKSFDELKKRVNEGVANLGVDRSVALQWIQNGKYRFESIGARRFYQRQDLRLLHLLVF